MSFFYNVEDSKFVSWRKFEETVPFLAFHRFIFVLIFRFDYTGPFFGTIHVYILYLWSTNYLKHKKIIFACFCRLNFFRNVIFFLFLFFLRGKK